MAYSEAPHGTGDMAGGEVERRPAADGPPPAKKARADPPRKDKGGPPPAPDISMERPLGDWEAVPEGKRDLHLRRCVDQAAKASDCALGIAVLDRALALGLRLPVHNLQTLLHLCAGGEGWEECLREAVAAGGVPPAGRTDVARGRELSAQVRERQGGQVPEMVTTAETRLLALRGDAEGALAHAQALAEQAAGRVKLRTFAPALVAASLRREPELAARAHAAVRAAGWVPTEHEYEHLVDCYAATGDRERMEALLPELQEELVDVGGPMARLLEGWFRSEAARGAFAPGGSLAGRGEGWATERVRVGPDGTSPAGELVPVALREREWGEFLEGIHSLAVQRENKKNSFENFVAWLKRHGPFEAIVDGANVALYGQNYDEGYFRFAHIKQLVDTLRRKNPAARPLVFLHVGRTRSPQARAPEGQAVLRELQDGGMLFTTPPGSNDDWYWLYACVAAGEKGMLVSNDLMRDHIFSLLAPKYFKKWRQRHQIKYAFHYRGSDAHLHLNNPPPFSRAVQQLPSGGWAFPLSDSEEWLLAYPEGAGAAPSVRPPPSESPLFRTVDADGVEEGEIPPAAGGERAAEDGA